MNLENVSLWYLISETLTKDHLPVIKSTATFRVVHTELDFADLEELGDVDKDGCEKGGEEVVEDPGVAGLQLPVVVGATHC